MQRLSTALDGQATHLVRVRARVRVRVRCWGRVRGTVRGRGRGRGRVRVSRRAGHARLGPAVLLPREHHQAVPHEEERDAHVADE